MTTIRVIAAVIDTEQLILYKEDGEQVILPQGDARIARIVKDIMPLVSRNLVATVSLEQENEYKNFEEKSSGIVKFFRIAKKMVQHIFNPETDGERVEPMTLGTVPTLELNEPIPIPNAGPTRADVTSAVEPKKMNTADAVKEIMEHAKPVSHENFHESQTKEDETMIAVVDNKIIPGVEKMKKHIAYSSKMGSTVGIEKFMQRVAAVIDKRGHSVEDLLKFMEKGDLPIADDGTIVAYKRLKIHGGTWVDVHSGRVVQRLGSYVCMDEKLVDPNRRNHCSNGLHIAQRGYLGGFSGDIMVLCKIAPEDVIAVPNDTSNKVRVCGYHIIDQIGADETSKLISNRAMTERPKAKEQLTKALRGDHIHRIEEVRITQSNGGGLKITPLKKDGTIDKIVVTKSDAKDHAFDDPKAKTDAVDIKAVSEQVADVKPKAEPKQEKASPAKVKEPVQTKEQKTKATQSVIDKLTAEPSKVVPVQETRNEKARRLYNAGLYDQIIQIKKTAKVTYEKLGFTKKEEEIILNKISPVEKVAKTTKAAKNIVAPTPTKKETPVAKSPKKKPASAKEVVKPVGPETNAQQVRRLYDAKAWGEMWNVKKKAKVSWQKLGLTDAEAKKANDVKPDWV